MKKSFLYTRTGDTGMTSLVGGDRIAKQSPRCNAYGEVDELNAHLGLVQAHCASIQGAGHDAALLLQISATMFNIGCYLATPSGKWPEDKAVIPDADITALEHRIDALDALLPAQTTFILPGGSIAASHAHVARTVCRRAERAILSFMDTCGEPLQPCVLRYVNRLSDYLFILARALNNLASIPDIPWIP